MPSPLVFPSPASQRVQLQPRRPCDPLAWHISRLVSGTAGCWALPAPFRPLLGGVLLTSGRPHCVLCDSLGNLPACQFPFSKSPLAAHFSLFKYDVTGNSCWDQQQFGLIELHKSKGGSVNLIYFLIVK